MSSATRGLAPIEADKAYPLPVFSEISGLNKSAMRSARRGGLVVRRLGNRGFVEGAEFLRYLRECGKVVEADGGVSNAK